MIRVEVDQADLRRVQKKLGDMKQKAPMVISRAINKTATTARVKLANKAQQAYTVKTTNFKKDMQIRKASYGNLEAIIRSEGKPLSLVSFKTTAPQSGAKAQVLKSGSLKKLIKGNTKAFKGTGKLNGQIYQREGQARKPLKKLSSNSVPVMIGSEKHVYGLVEPQIKSDLKRNIEAQIRLLVG